MWDVRGMGCSGCEMFGMWDVRDVRCSGCGMFGMWDVQDVGCSGCGMFGMWDIRDMGCFGCGMFGMWDVGCLPGCAMLIYKMPIVRGEMGHSDSPTIKKIYQTTCGITKETKCKNNGTFSILSLKYVKVFICSSYSSRLFVKAFV